MPRAARSEGAAQPDDEGDEKSGRNERAPPSVQAEGAESPRAELDVKHDQARPCERADEVQRAELEGIDPCDGAGDRNRRSKARQEASRKNDERLMLAHVPGDPVLVLGHARKTVQPMDASTKQIKPELIACC